MKTEAQIRKTRRSNLKNYRWWSLRKDSGRALTFVFGVGTLAFSFSIAAWQMLQAHSLLRSPWASNGVALAFAVGVPLSVYWAKRHASRVAFEKLPPLPYAELVVEGQDPPVVLSSIAWEMRALCAELYIGHRLGRFGTGRVIDAMNRERQDVESRSSARLLDRVVRACSRQLHGVPPWMRELRRCGDRACQGEAVSVTDIRMVIESARQEVQNYCAQLAHLLREQHPQILRISEMKRLAARELGIPARRLCDHVFRFSPTLYRTLARKYLLNLEELLALPASVTPEVEERAVGLVRQCAKMRADLEWRVDCQYDLMAFDRSHQHMLNYCADRSVTGALKEYLKVLSGVAAGSNERVMRAELRFHYLRQKTRPGFDLHELARALFSDDEEIHAALNVIALDRHAGRRNTGALKRLYRSATERIQRARKIVVARANRYLEDNARDELVIVSHGYGKTVRDVLRVFLASEAGDGSTVYLLNRRSNSDDLYETQRMEWELKRTLPVHLGRRARECILAGDEKLLISLVGERARVVFLLGVECFDDESVLHPLGQSQKFHETREKLKEQYRLVAVAEEYKRVPDVGAASQFFHDHLDCVGTLSVDNVITEVAD